MEDFNTWLCFEKKLHFNFPFAAFILRLKGRCSMLSTCQSDLALSIFLDLSIAEVVESYLLVSTKKQNLLYSNQSSSREGNNRFVSNMAIIHIKI